MSILVTIVKNLDFIKTVRKNLFQLKFSKILHFRQNYFKKLENLNIIHILLKPWILSQFPEISILINFAKNLNFSEFFR